MTIDPEEANTHIEPCVSCGEETAIGSVFFSDRHEGALPDGRRIFVCSECLKHGCQEPGHVDMSDPDVYMAIVAGAQFVFRDSSF